MALLHCFSLSGLIHFNRQPANALWAENAFPSLPKSSLYFIKSGNMPSLPDHRGQDPPPPPPSCPPLYFRSLGGRGHGSLLPVIPFPLPYLGWILCLLFTCPLSGHVYFWGSRSTGKLFAAALPPPSPKCIFLTCCFGKCLYLLLLGGQLCGGVHPCV